MPLFLPVLIAYISPFIEKKCITYCSASATFSHHHLNLSQYVSGFSLCFCLHLRVFPSSSSLFFPLTPLLVMAIFNAFPLTDHFHSPSPSDVHVHFATLSSCPLTIRAHHRTSLPMFVTKKQEIISNDWCEGRTTVILGNTEPEYEWQRQLH